MSTYNWARSMLIPAAITVTPKTDYRRNAGELLEITRELFYWLTEHVEYCCAEKCNECKLYGRISKEMISVYYGNGKTR